MSRSALGATRATLGIMNARAKEMLQEVLGWERKEREAFVAELLEADGSADAWTSEMLARAEEALEDGAELLEADEVYARVRADLAAARAMK